MRLCHLNTGRKKRKIQAGSRPAWQAGRSLEARGLREMGRDSPTHPRSPSERGQAEAESWDRVARLGHSRVPCGSAMPGEAPSSQAEEKQVQTGRWAVFPWPPAPRRWLRLWAPGSMVGVQRPRRCPETRLRGRHRGSWAAGRRKGAGKGPAPVLSQEPSCPLVSRLPLPFPTPQARSGLTEPLPVGCALAV